MRQENNLHPRELISYIFAYFGKRAIPFIFRNPPVEGHYNSDTFFFKFWFQIPMQLTANKSKFQSILWKWTEIPWNNHFSKYFPWKFHGANYFFLAKIHGTKLYLLLPSTGGGGGNRKINGMAQYDRFLSHVAVKWKAKSKKPKYY